MDETERSELFDQTGIAAQASQQANQSAATQYYLEEQQKNLAETQLDVKSITAECYHLLKQDIFTPDDKGGLDWKPLPNKVKRILTDEGVDHLMTNIHFIINKNTLLSNFDEKQISTMMLRATTEINDLMYMTYETFFYQASIEECIKVLKERQGEQAKIRAYAYEIATGKIKTQLECENEIVRETAHQVEYEIKKIREEQRRGKLRHYPMIISQVEVLIIGALNRAWKGEERGSIRRHTNISEIIGGRPQQGKGANNNTGGFKWFNN